METSCAVPGAWPCCCSFPSAMPSWCVATPLVRRAADRGCRERWGKRWRRSRLSRSCLWRTVMRQRVDRWPHGMKGLLGMGWWRMGPMGMGEDKATWWHVFVAVLGFSDIEFHWWSQTKSDWWFEGTETWMFKPKNNGSFVTTFTKASGQCIYYCRIFPLKLRVFQDFSMKHQQSPWISLWFDCQGVNRVNSHFSSSTTIYLWLTKQWLLQAPFLSGKGTIFVALNHWEGMKNCLRGKPTWQLRGLSQRCEGQPATAFGPASLGAGILCQGAAKMRFGLMGLNGTYWKLMTRN